MSLHSFFSLYDVRCSQLLVENNLQIIIINYYQRVKPIKWEFLNYIYFIGHIDHKPLDFGMFKQTHTISGICHYMSLCMVMYGGISMGC